MESTAPKPFVFVLMPFGPEFDDVYQLGIKAACHEAGAYCERVDEQNFHGSILDRIYNQISKADIVVADMSGRNPNVFYEVGYAHALEKPVLLLTNKTDDIPFDFKHYYHIVYSGRIVELKDKLSAKIQWLVKSPERTRSTTSDVFAVYLNDKLVEDGEPYVFKFGLRNSVYVDIKINNISSTLFKPDDFKLCVVAPEGLHVGSGTPSSEEVIINRETVTYFDPGNKFFPDQWLGFNLEIYPYGSGEISVGVHNFKFMILSTTLPKTVPFKIVIEDETKSVPF